MRGFLAILIVSLSAAGSAQKIHFSPVDKEVVLDRVANAPSTNDQRHARIKELFTQSGCSGSALVEQQIPGSEIPNIICRLNGSSDETIVVSAVYGIDANSNSQNSKDDWSAATLLASLYQSLLDQKRHHSYLFVAFAGKSEGDPCSAFYSQHMTEEQVRQTEAVLNLNALGLSPTKVWMGQSDKDLVHSLVLVTYTLRLPFSQVDMQNSAATVPVSFSARQIPRITVHSLTQEDVSGNRNAELRPGNYFDTYRLLSCYLAYLDSTLKPRASAK